MDDIVNVRMFLEHLVEILLLPHVHLSKVWSFARDELDTIKDFLRRIVQVVGNDDLVSRLEQR